MDKEWTRRDGEWGEAHSVLPGVKSGDWRVLVDKEWTRRDGEWGEAHSVLPGVKSGGLEGVSGQRVDQKGWWVERRTAQSSQG